MEMCLTRKILIKSISDKNGPVNMHEVEIAASGGETKSE
jgi:hypothetical protein